MNVKFLLRKFRISLWQQLLNSWILEDWSRNKGELKPHLLVLVKVLTSILNSQLIGDHSEVLWPSFKLMIQLSLRRTLRKNKVRSILWLRQPLLKQCFTRCRELLVNSKLPLSFRSTIPLGKRHKRPFKL